MNWKGNETRMTAIGPSIQHFNKSLSLGKREKIKGLKTVQVKTKLC